MYRKFYSEKNRGKSALKTIILALVILLVISFTSGANSIHEDAYQRLTKIVNDKKTQLSSFLQFLQQKAERIQDDHVMRNFFRIKNQYYNSYKNTPAPDEIKNLIDQLKQEIQKYYLEAYLDFYNILFINADGEVIYSIRKEAEYHQNIFQGELGKTNLSKLLKQDKTDKFVDFQYFYPSDKPAAFFVIPILEAGETNGWFILQSSINKVNSLFAGCDELGDTGEVFLVNKEQFMLTESRFTGESTILRKHLNRDNIYAKFKEKKGNMIVNDYRGFRALSSFEVFSFLNSEWLIIAKIDEDKVITDYYREHKDDLKEKIIEFTSSGKFGGEKSQVCRLSQNQKIVDMDEFVREDNHRILRTFGVSTCTAAIISYPEKFAYLAHLSSHDKMYNPEVMYTDLLGEIARRVTTFDIYPCQKRELQFFIVANHLNSLPSILDYLLNNGILLSQIYFVNNPSARSANVHYDYVANKLCSEWKTKDNGIIVQTNEELLSIGEILR